MLATDGQRVTSLVEEPPIEGKPYASSPSFLLITLLIITILITTTFLFKDQPQKLERMGEESGRLVVLLRRREDGHIRQISETAAFSSTVRVNGLHQAPGPLSVDLVSRQSMQNVVRFREFISERKGKIRCD